MKKLVFALGFLMAASICAEGHNPYTNHVSISIQTFYDELAPYGEWIYTPDYGYAWRPYLDDREEFRPYASRGNWVYTDLGWTWVSDYHWGWATFHYGRWFYDNYFGWMWLPGNEWAPAWVTWGRYNDCWAWAPMGPNMNAGIYYNWHPPDFWWVFVPFRHFCAHNWYSYIYKRPVQVTNITYINNYYYGDDNRHNTWTWDYGPRVAEVEKHARTIVRKRTLVDADTPVNLAVRENTVPVYRPGVTQKRENPQPANVRTVDKGKVVTRTTDPVKINSRTTDPVKVNTRTTEQRKVTPAPKQDPGRTTITGTQKQQTERSTPARMEPSQRENEKTGKTHYTTSRTNPAPATRPTAPPKANVKAAVKESGSANTAPPKTKSR